MQMLASVCVLPFLYIAAGATVAAPPSTAKAALQPLHDLIGEWRGTGEPAGTREEKLKNFWTEKIRWEWRFKDKDVWLSAVMDKGKHYKAGELRWLPASGVYQLTLRPTTGDVEVYVGKLDQRRLVLDRTTDPDKEGRRVVVSLLHPNRHLFRVDVRPAGKVAFAPLFQIGATKEGVPFAAGDSYPVCIVTGGRGTMSVTYKGKTFYVCCSGCRDAFNEEPEKYIKEFEEKQKAGGK